MKIKINTEVVTCNKDPQLEIHLGRCDYLVNKHPHF